MNRFTPMIVPTPTRATFGDGLIVGALLTAMACIGGYTAAQLFL